MDSTFVVSDTLSKDAVSKPLCQRYYREYLDEYAEKKTLGEVVRAIVECRVTRNGSTFGKTETIQEREFEAV